MKNKLNFYTKLISTILDSCSSYVVLIENLEIKLISSHGTNLLDLATLKVISNYFDSAKESLSLIESKAFKNIVENNELNFKKINSIGYLPILDENKNTIGYLISTFDKSLSLTKNQKNTITLIAKKISEKLGKFKTTASKDIYASESIDFKLNLTKEILKKTFKFSNDVFCIVNKEQKFEFVSNASYNVWGYTPEEMIGNPFENYIVEEDVLETLEIDHHVRNKSEISLFENRYLHKNGTIKNMLWSANWDDESELLYCIAKDVTDFKKIIEKNDENENLLIEAQRLAKMGSWNYNIKEDKLSWSDGLYTVFDINKELFLETHASFLDFIIPEDRDFAVQMSKKTQETGEPFNIVYRIKTPSGEERIVEEFGYSEKDATGKITRLFGTAQDITERKKNEFLLQDSNKKYKYLFDNSPVPLFMWDFETLKIIDCNIESLMLYGYTREEFLQLTIKDIRPKEDIDLIVEVTENEDIYGQIHKKGWRHLKKNGELMYVDITAHLLDYNNRRCSLVLITDITAKIELEKKQKEHIQFIETTLENLPIGIAVNKINDGSATLMNAKFHEIYGWPKDDLTDVSTFFEKVYPDEEYRKKIINQVVDDMASRNPEKMNWEGITITTQNGTKRIVNAKNIPIYDQDLMISTVVDVTEKYNIQKSLQLSNERYLYATQASSDAIWDCDFENNQVYRAEGFKTIFGFKTEELNSPNTIWESYIHPDDRLAVTKSINEIINGNENYWKHEYRFIKPNGEEVFVHDSAFLIRDENNKVIRIIGALKDITESNYYQNVEILEREILEINALGSEPINEVIAKYLLGIEKLHADMLCSMQVRKGEQLFNLASPSLPEDFIETISGITIGDNVGSCGTAAFTRKKVIVTDIPNDIRWANYKEVAAEYGLKACWSHPILNSEGEVLATFATYYRKVKSPTTVEENTIERASHILQIILESYLKKNALKESNLRYDYATKATSDAIWDWDFENDLVYRAEGFKTIFGFDLDELNSPTSNWKDYIHSEDRIEAYQSILDAIKSNDNYWKHDYRIIKPDGKVAFVQDSAYIIRGENNRVTRIIGALKDVTQRKKEEQQLKLFASVATNTNDAVIITEAEPFDEPGPKILYVNEAFTKMSGYTAEEVIGKTPRILQGPKSDKIELERLRKALENWESYETTIINYKKNGEEFWINFSVTPVADDNGWYTHWIAIERDVTIRKNEELQNELIAYVSSVLNEPLKLNETLYKTLHCISKFGDFCFAEAWLTSSDQNILKKLSSYAATENSRLFLDETNAIDTFKHGEGFPGIVSESKEIIIWGDLANQKQFLRRDVVSKYGLKTIIGLPLLYSNEVIGVITFGLDYEIIDTAKYYNLFKKLGDYLSPEIKRKQLELELNKMFNFAPDLIVILGLDGHLKKVNPAACQLLGYTQEELCAEPYVNFIHPEYRENYINQVEKLLETNLSYYFENRNITKSGKIKWLAWNAIYVPEDNNIYAVAKDITDKKELEELLQKVNELASIGGWEMDLQNNTLFWSDVTKEIIEVSPDFIPGIEMAIAFYKNDSYRTKITEYVQEAKNSGKSWDDEFEIVTAKGNNRWIRVMGDAEFVNGNCIRIYGSMQNITEGKLAAEKIKESEARLTASQSVAKVGSWETDLITFDVIWSDETCRIFGVENNLTQTTHENFLKFVHPEDKEKVEKAFEDSFTSVSVNSIEHRIIAADGFIKEVEEKWLFKIDENGKPIRALGTIQDITARKKVEVELRSAIEKAQESDARFKSYTQQSPIAIYTTDINGDCIYANETWLEMAAMQLEDALGKGWMSALHPDDLEYVTYNWYKSIESKGEWNYEYRFLNSNKNIIWVSGSAKKLFNDKNEHIGYLGSNVNITERKKAEEEIKNTEERRKLIMNAALDAIICIDKNGKITFWNPQAEQIFGWSEEEVMGQLLTTLIVPERLRAMHDNGMKNYLKTGKGNALNVLLQLSAIRRDGEEFPIELTVLPISQDGEEFFCAFIRDITERKTHEDQLLKLNKDLNKQKAELITSNKELEQFAYVASHDLQEPLRMVTSFLTLLEKRYIDVLDEKGLKYINFAVDGAKNMRQIILDILEFSRLNDPEDNYELIDLKDIINDISLLQGKLIKDKKAKIIFENLHKVNSIRHYLIQLFQNIISNALKYSKEEVPLEIIITSEEFDDYYQISVKDNGIGIEEEYYEKIFIIFQRLHGKEKYEGNGMGLAIAKKIVDKLNGKIWVKSQVGIGSTFYINIPKK